LPSCCDLGIFAIGIHALDGTLHRRPGLAVPDDGWLLTIMFVFTNDEVMVALNGLTKKTLFIIALID
jgi:hypothetical protein